MCFITNLHLGVDRHGTVVRDALNLALSSKVLDAPAGYASVDLVGFNHCVHGDHFHLFRDFRKQFLVKLAAKNDSIVLLFADLTLGPLFLSLRPRGRGSGEGFLSLGLLGLFWWHCWLCLMDPKLCEEREGDGVFAIVNTHFTFPHCRSDDMLRFKQAESLLRRLDSIFRDGKTQSRGGGFSSRRKGYLKDGGGSIDMFVLGDFNGEVDDVYRLFKNHGFESSYSVSNGGLEPEITHLNHRGDKVGVDYIWYRPGRKSRSSVKVIDSYAAPKGVSTKEWPSDFTISDHRPIVSDFHLAIRKSKNDAKDDESKDSC
mmetsp:Transcript_24427/g.43352  ORF Transcript_24427/g.43352 Transcript_24427/m.43352 type:complete len:315 (-) Transcript_24427:242-1186(-)